MDPISSGSGSNNLFITRIELFNIMRNSGCRKLGDQFIFLKQHLVNCTNCPEVGLTALYHTISHFTSRFKEKWIKSERVEPRFLKKNDDWLKTAIGFTSHEVTPTRKRGRPEITFEESSDRSKRIKTQDLRNNTSLPQLGYATKMNLRASGQPIASKLVEDIIRSPRRASRYRQAYRAFEEDQTKKISGEEALSAMVEAKLTRCQYNVIRAKDPERFPSYKVLQTAKKKCYPNKEDITITPTSAEVTIQALLNHTAERLIHVQKEVIFNLKPEQLTNLCLISKWGFDGSSGHSSCGRFQCIHKDNKDVVWQNPRPSSTRYCRPIKINFIKESTQLSIAEKNRMDTQIENIRSSPVEFEGNIILVSHKLTFTMVDGKICNALTDTASTQRCYIICGASSKDFNSIDKLLTKSYDASTLQFGLSVLHCWIRSFECLLHVGYKLPIKKWQARNQDKGIVAENKIRIQQEFKNQMGLIVDQPKPGFGNSNDGNTARRFFGNADLASEITGIDKQLIVRMHTILVAISSGYSINIDKFRKFTIDTATYFVQMYPWFYMPPTVHKLLIHGPDVISAVLLPIGQLSEEAQQARNKDFKKYRENYSRKCSREKCNEGVFSLMLITSDPVITSYRQLPKKQLKYFSKEVLDLIISPDVPLSDISNTVSDDECSSTASDC